MPKAKKRPDARSKVNLAADLPDEGKWLADRLVQHYQRDAMARAGWYEQCEGAYKLASCLPIRNPDEKPWESAANIVVPILASTVLQFSARAYAAMFEQGYPQRVKVLPVEVGDIERAGRVEALLNWQTIIEMEEYESEWDQALLDWPIFGHIFKKVYWDVDLKRPVSVYCPATDVYVPYGSRPRLTPRSRITHLLPPMSYCELEEHEDADYFINVDACKGSSTSNAAEMRLQRAHDEIFGYSRPTAGGDEENDHDIIETHFFGKLSEDDDEPDYYKAWVDVGSRTLLRASSRRVRVGGGDHVVDEFVSIPFMPNPRGPYGIGFGTYLTPLNEIANTLYNQFIDAGSLANQPFVFYTRGAGLNRRDLRLFPGAAIPVNDINEIREGKLTGLGNELPILLNYVNEFSRDLSSVSEEMTGRTQKGVREPTVRGTFARIEQGTQVFSVIVKRGMREQRGEINKIAKLDELFMPAKKIFRVLGATTDPFGTANRKDFGANLDFLPTADPSFASPQAIKAEAVQLGQLMLQFPLVQGVPQLGIPPNVELQLDLMRDVLRTHGKIEMLGRLPPSPEPTMDPNRENQRFTEGGESEVKPGEDHIGHNIEHLAYLASDVGRALPNEVRRKLVEHTVKHTLRFQFEQQQAAMQQAAQREAQAGQAPGAPANGAPQPGGTEDAAGTGGVGLNA